MTENERIKMIRKSKEVNLTLEKFGARLGVTKTAISLLENAKTSVTDQMRRSICREFGVNEKWLRTGEGEMFAPPTAFSLDDFMKKRGATELELEIVKAYFDYPADQRAQLIEHFTKRLAAVTPDGSLEDTAPGAAVPAERLGGDGADEALKPDTPDEAEERRRLHEALDRELDEEKEARERSQALQRIG
jgi:transcriptional regulator with XRE-family HTH domain